MPAPSADITGVADSSNTTTGFLDLSAQLRNEIYELVISGPALDHASTTDFRDIKVPALCQVNRQIRNEVLPVVHHSWASLPGIDTGLRFFLDTPGLRSSFLKWLPTVGSVVLPQMRDFHMTARGSDEARVSLRIAFDQTAEEHNIIVGDRGFLFGDFASAGKTDVICDLDFDFFGKQYEALPRIARFAEHLLQGCEPRRLTVANMEALMRRALHELSAGSLRL